MTRHRSSRRPKRDPLTLPYGCWWCQVGDEFHEVLFDRKRRGLWQRPQGSPATPFTGKHIRTTFYHGLEKLWIHATYEAYLHRGAGVDREQEQKLLQAEQDFIAGKRLQIRKDHYAGQLVMTSKGRRPSLRLIEGGKN